MPSADAPSGRYARTTERLLAPLGVVAPLGDLPAAIRVASDHPELAADFLRRHRVVGLGLRRLLQAAENDQLAAPLRELANWRRELDGLLEAGWAELADGVTATGVATAGIKGLAMRAEYQHALDRDAGDIDVMVHTVDDAWELATWLRGRGYDWCEYEWPWIKRDLPTSKIYGQFQVWKQVGDQYLRFDVHFGGYSVRHCRLASCAPSRPGLSLIGPSGNLPCLLGNSSGDFLLRLKDVNDIAVLLTSGWRPGQQELDMIQSLGLARFWNALLDRMRALTLLTEDEQHAVRGLRLGYGHQRVPFGHPSPRARTRATVADAFRYGVADGGLRRAVAVARGAYSYYSKKHQLTIGPCAHPDRAAMLRDLTNETCVRLIPPRLIGDGPSDAARHAATHRRQVPGTQLLTEVVSGQHAYLEGSDERLVPTLSYHLCAVEAAGNAAAADG